MRIHNGIFSLLYNLDGQRRGVMKKSGVRVCNTSILKLDFSKNKPYGPSNHPRNTQADLVSRSAVREPVQVDLLLLQGHGRRCQLHVAPLSYVNVSVFFQAGINLQSGDHLDRFVSEAALAPAVCQSFAGGSSNPPKFGTLIPNRIFVGGIPSNTTEQELKTFFSSFGQVKDVKIISDRLGVSKGKCFQEQVCATSALHCFCSVLVRSLDHSHWRVFFLDLPTALFFAGGAMPYSFQNGMAVFSLPGQDYSMLTQAAPPYATMMLSQPGGSTAVYLPSPLHSTASPYAQLSQQQVAAAALQQQHYQAACPTSAVAPAVAASHLAPVTVSANNIGTQSNSTTAVMAAAAAAMAAAVQWPQQTVTNSIPPPQLASVAAHNVPQAANATHSVISNSSITAQQAAAMAAAVAAQQAAWRWSPTVNQQHQPQSSAHVTSCSANVSSSGASITVTNIMGSTTSTPAIHSQSLHNHQQGSPTATLGPTTYLYSPIAGTGHELMLFHQTSSPYAANSTSDYSTDHSTHSSGMLESVEPLGFPCDGTPLGRHPQHLTGQLAGALGNQHLDAACLSPYATFTPIMDLHSHTANAGQPNALIQSATLQQSFRQPQHQATATLLAASQAASAQHIVPIAHSTNTLVQHSQPHAKLYSPSVLSSVAHTGQTSVGLNTCQLPSGLYVNPTIKVNALSELNSADLPDPSSISQTTALQTIGTGGASCITMQNTPVTQMSNTGTVQCNQVVSTLTGEPAVCVGSSHH
ncbi:uncharacterized protein DEA37_0004801 [Paragonimus westermani]|uniref:RRM domain-containing protein n=1 Tax=Paragonimus westermani TaxID=34504 RepID=A0A5J4NEU2_9TREM|nr:uncharacterized protein DEA37_0004801 [Paragonimus westermani]